MFSFKNDYSEGAHPNIIKALTVSNLNQEDGYGLDTHSLKAIEYLRREVNDNNADIHFISGGTQMNLLVIQAFLRPHEAVLAASTGHISTHEAGAIEATGHKIVEIETVDGKLNTEHLDVERAKHHFEHMVKPKLVYISNPTELGTVYTKEELQELRAYCDLHDLYLYCDGARLGSLLAATDLTMEDMYKLTDALFVGGTKNGALLGEALILRNKLVSDEFRYMIKQRGALLAKGRIMGIQFEELFRDGLYYELAEHSNVLAQKLANGLKEMGYSFLVDSITNQIFPILPNDLIDKLQEEFDFYVWLPMENGVSAIRLITSWATPVEQVDKFLSLVNK